MSKMQQRVKNRRESKEAAASAGIVFADRFLCLTCRKDIELDIRATIGGEDRLKYFKKVNGTLVGFYCSSNCAVDNV